MTGLRESRPQPSQPSWHQRRALFSLGTGKAPEFDLLEVVAPIVPDGDDDLVVVCVDFAAQGAPHPQRLGSQLEVRLLLEYLLLNILNCKTDFWVSHNPRAS